MSAYDNYGTANKDENPDLILDRDSKKNIIKCKKIGNYVLGKNLFETIH